jgi:hypothetical protein
MVVSQRVGIAQNVITDFLQQDMRVLNDENELSLAHMFL